MSARKAVAKAAKAGVALSGGVALSSGQAAESQAYSSSDLFPQVVLHDAPVKGAGEEAGQVVSKDNIAEAAALITEASRSSPDILESVTLSGDGSHAWLGVGSVDLSHASFKSFESFVTLSAELAADPEFQRLIVAKENALQRRCLSASASAVSLAQSDFNDWTTAAGSEPGTPTAVSVSGSELLVFENEELRKQNDGLRAELRKLAAASATPADPAEAAVRACVGRAIDGVLSEAAAADTAAAKARARSRRPSMPRLPGGDLPRNAAVVGAAVVVGLLAILVSRNPASAKAAATSAALTVLSLLHRVPPRTPADKAA
mmetsp:Transcript_23292/g.74599  ORF Transcript_23292/g.74599 Transcript_23292/m.74599 type:complete len:318 (+) Transcript_23292:50-1003(+)